MRVESPLRIVAYSLNHLGDVLFTEPALLALKAGHPDSHLVVVTSAMGIQVLKHQPYIDGILERRRGFLGFLQVCRRVRTIRPDIAVDFSPSSLGTAVSAFFSGAKVTAGFGMRPGMKHLFKKTLPLLADRHIVDDNLALAEAVGGRTLRRYPELTVTHEEQEWAEEWLKEHNLSHQPLIGFQPFASSETRLWEMEKWVQLIKGILKIRNCTPLIFGGQEDREKGKELAKESGAFCAAGHLSIRQFIAVVRHCVAFVGLDSGPTHLASVLGVATLILYGPGTRGPIRAGPLGRVSRILAGDMNTWRGIDPEKALTVIRQLMAADKGVVIEDRNSDPAVTGRLVPGTGAIGGNLHNSGRTRK